MASIDNTSCGIFGMDDPLRKLCFTVSLSKRFDSFILCVILANCFCMVAICIQIDQFCIKMVGFALKMTNFCVSHDELNTNGQAMDSPYIEEGSTLQIFLQIMDIIFTLIFVGEMLIKVIATGFINNGYTSYLRDSWNQLDFSIVMISVVDFTLTYILVVDGDIGIMKVFRGVRCIRPLRMLTKMKGLQMLVRSFIPIVYIHAGD